MIETLLKYLNPTYVISIGAFISIIGSILAAKQSDIERKKTDDTLLSVSQVTTETNKQITGGDSYCSMVVSFNPKTNKPRFDLNHVGDTKIEKVQIIIVDSGKLNAINHLASTDLTTFLEEYKKCMSKFNFDILYPNTVRTDIPITLDQNLKDIELSFEIRFGNRVLHQTIHVNEYKTSNRVIKSKLVENDKVIIESEISA